MSRLASSKRGGVLLLPLPSQPEICATSTLDPLHNACNPAYSRSALTGHAITSVVWYHLLTWKSSPLLAAQCLQRSQPQKSRSMLHHLLSTSSTTYIR